MINRKAQSAMEYLMTYGWAVLVVVIVLAALFYLGVFDSKSDIKGGVEGPFTYDLKVGQDGIQLSLRSSNIVKSGTINSIKINGQDCSPDKTNINGGTNELITCTNSGLSIPSGSNANVEVYFSYIQQNSALSHDLSISKKVYSEGDIFIGCGNSICETMESFTKCPVDCKDNIISYWLFDEGNGIIAEDLSSNNDGTLINGATWAIGKKGTAVNFDGINDYVEIPASALDFGYDAFTISFWVNTNANAWININEHGFITTNAYFDSIDFRYRSLEFVLSVKNSIGNLFETFNNNANALGSPPSVNTWYFLTGTMNSNNICIYINSILEDCKAFSGTRYDSNQNLKIGRGGASTGFYFNGLIDELIIFDKALSPTEVSELYNYYQ